MLCVKCSVMVQRFEHYDGMSKNDWKHLRYDLEKVGAYKMDRQNKKNAVVLEKKGEGRIMLELTRQRKKNAGTLAKKKLLDEGCSKRNGKRIEGSRQKKYHMMDNIMINELYVDTKR